MSSDVIISTAGLGKKYLIGHSAGRDGNLSFREVVGDTVRGATRAIARLAKNQQIAVGASTEEFWALKDVAFNISRGDVVGIVGRNGAGKSTLLKILSRITEPTEGRVTIRGRVASLLEVGTGFHGELSGRENVYLNGAILGMRQAEVRRKFDEIVDFAGVEKFIDTPVKRYSSGMYVRLAFAVAAHLEPEILIVDEVLAVGDAEFQAKCLGKMKDVAGHGRTVLFVSHNIHAVERMCSKVLWLTQGRAAPMRSDVAIATGEYLYGAKSATVQAVWQGDNNVAANAYFDLTRVVVEGTAEQHVADGVFSNAENIKIIIKGYLKHPDPALNFGFDLFTSAGDHIIQSYNTDVPQAEWWKPTRGAFELQATLPRRTLNEGTYRLEIFASIHNKQWLLEPGSNCPSVVFKIQGGLSDSPFYVSKRPSLLGIVLPWQGQMRNAPAESPAMALSE